MSTIVSSHAAETLEPKSVATSSLYQPTRVVLAADVVAYLPIFLAKSFGLSHKGIASREGWADAFSHFSTPSPGLLPRDLDQKEAVGDRAVLHEISFAWDNHQQASIGICDPCEIPAIKQKNDLVLVGGLVRQACFWCVGDESLKGATSLATLTVDHLAMHEPGSTGHYIGRDLAKSLTSTSGGHPEIYEGPIDLVVDGAIYLKEKDERARVMAVTASVLSAALAKNRALPFLQPVGTLDSKFNEFLTTGIVVHREALAVDPVFRSRVELFLYGIIHATHFFRHSPDLTKQLLTKFCASPDRFKGERKLDSAKVTGHKIVSRRTSTTTAPVPAQAIDDCYSLLTRTEIYSDQCEVTEAEWHNACFGDRASQVVPWPALDTHFDDGPLKAAQLQFVATFTGQKHEEALRRAAEIIAAKDAEIAARDHKISKMKRVIRAMRIALIAIIPIAFYPLLVGPARWVLDKFGQFGSGIAIAAVVLLLATVVLRWIAISAIHDEQPKNVSARALKRFGRPFKIGARAEGVVWNVLAGLLGTILFAIINSGSSQPPN